MCAKIVGLVWKGGMRERRAKNRLFNDIQSYHPARREFGLTKVAFKEGYPAVARIESANTTTAMVCLAAYREHNLLARERANVLFPEFFCPFTRMTGGLKRLAASCAEDNGDAESAVSQDGGTRKARIPRTVLITWGLMS